MAPKVPSHLLKDFVYDLPEGRIATHPAEPRDSSKLLYYHGEIAHREFSELPLLLPERSLLIYNETRVIPARLLFAHAQKRIEVFLLKPLQADWSVWEVMVGNRRKFKEGDELKLERELGGKVLGLKVRWAEREKDQLYLEGIGASVAEAIEELGRVPLPPYIKRDAEERDRADYQTVFARMRGAVAAPTASLHFTERVLDAIKAKGHMMQALTLHVGAGTFKPVDVADVSAHEMHSERYEISTALLDALGGERPVVALGTTSMRVLESLYYIGAKILAGEENPERIYKEDGYDARYAGYAVAEAMQALRKYVTEKGGVLQGETSIFIVPGFEFRVVRGLVTNFHQPGSTLLLLVAAFVGEDWKEIYRQGIAGGYRFLSYGDANLLWPEKNYHVHGSVGQ